MNRDTILALLQLVETIWLNVEEAKRTVDGDALQVSDRHIIDHSIATIMSEVAVLARTFAGMLEDPTKNA